MTLSIGLLARAADVKIPTIRFYEEIGLLPEPRRAANDRRVYDDAAIRRLAFIRHARQLGFSVEAIRNLLDLSDNPERPCGEANALAARQFNDVEAKIAQLETLRGELRRMVAETCDGRSADCRVIEALAGLSRPSEPVDSRPDAPT
jgi:DNA-binding transcriptional MerR regulator